MSFLFVQLSDRVSISEVKKTQVIQTGYEYDEFKVTLSVESIHASDEVNYRCTAALQGTAKTSYKDINFTIISELTVEFL